MMRSLILLTYHPQRVVLRTTASVNKDGVSDPHAFSQPGPSTGPGELPSSSFGWSVNPGDAHDNSKVDPNASNNSANPKYGRYPSLGSPNHSPAPFYFNIGTVETFERKLEEAQRALGIAPRDFIPVIYVNETSWSQEFMK
jgi:hypothetical protein